MGFCVWLNVKIFWFYNQMKRAIAFTNWGLKKTIRIMPRDDVGF